MPTPRNNKTKRADTARPTKSKRRKQNDPGPQVENQPLEAVQPAQEPPVQDYDAWSTDEETVLMFLSYYQALEGALLRAGYTRAGRTPGTAQPDWPRFARHIQPQFNLDSTAVLEGAVAYMLGDDDNRALRNEFIEEGFAWENPDPHNDIVWLAELLQQTRRKLLHGLNFPGQSSCDIAMVCAALFIVEEWSRLDAEVKGLLAPGL